MSTTRKPSNDELRTIFNRCYEFAMRTSKELVEVSTPLASAGFSDIDEIAEMLDDDDLRRKCEEVSSQMLSSQDKLDAILANA